MHSLVNIVKFADNNPGQVILFFLPEYDAVEELHKLIGKVASWNANAYVSDHNYNLYEFGGGTTIGIYKLNSITCLRPTRISALYVDMSTSFTTLASLRTQKPSQDCPIILFEFTGIGSAALSFSLKGVAE